MASQVSRASRAGLPPPGNDPVATPRMSSRTSVVLSRTPGSRQQRPRHHALRLAGGMTKPMTVSARATINSTMVEEATTREAVLVEFTLFSKARPGESFVVVGNGEELGDWTVESGLTLEWAEGDIWRGVMALWSDSPAPEFKFVKICKDGSVQWEGGEDRMVEVPANAANVSVRCFWESPKLELEVVELPKVNASEVKDAFDDLMSSNSADKNQEAAKETLQDPSDLRGSIDELLEALEELERTPASRPEAALPEPPSEQKQDDKKPKQQQDSFQLKFSMRCQMDPGQSLLVIGSAAEIGDWTPESALTLERCQGGVWSGSIKLPKDTRNIDFKLVKKNSDGKLEWQGGANHKLEFPEIKDSSQEQAFEACGSWEDKTVKLQQASKGTKDDGGKAKADARESHSKEELKACVKETPKPEERSDSTPDDELEVVASITGLKMDLIQQTSQSSALRSELKELNQMLVEERALHHKAAAMSREDRSRLEMEMSELKIAIAENAADMDAQSKSTIEDLSMNLELERAAFRALKKELDEARSELKIALEKLQNVLCVASSGGDMGAVRQLLEAGADPNVTSGASDGKTALAIACEAGHKDLVAVLLQSGADAEKVDDNGWSPLHLAAGNGHEDVVDLLLGAGVKVDNVSTDGSGWTPLARAAAAGSEAIVEKLLDAGAEVDKDWMGNGHTPLVVAICADNWNEKSHLPVCARLIDRGADPDYFSSSHGNKVLDLAVRMGRREVALLLLKRGAKSDDNLDPEDYMRLVHWLMEEVDRKDSEVAKLLARDMAKLVQAIPEWSA